MCRSGLSQLLMLGMFILILIPPLRKESDSNGALFQPPEVDESHLTIGVSTARVRSQFPSPRGPNREQMLKLEKTKKKPGRRLEP